DAGTVQASQLAPELGLVGKVERVDPELLDTLTDRGFLPAVACIAGGADGAIFNVNADQMAAACATGLAADQVVFLTDVGGVLDRRGETIPKLSASEAESLITEGVAKGGMEAKLRAAVSALTGGIERVSIVNGHEPDILTRALEGVAAGSELSA
ncbi:MAG: acetylglutamate kinase, partial [Acidobacteriia bacterium]|nr:acetylglutamate kinase [Terriglobia bacterium]